MKASTWEAMKPSRNTPVLFFDFDNTITREDVLDRIIERFSISDEWRNWEAAWVRGEISTVQCLDRQMAGLRAYKAELIDFVADCQIDPYFAPIVQWAASARVELFVVSDNFSCLVREILARHGLADVPVMANELTFSGNRLQAHFPFRSASCERCAHCKAVHFQRYERRRKIYVGDGLSDVCPALAADVVFAKDSLADYLSRCGVAFRDFASLKTLADFLVADGRRTRRASVQARTQTLAESLPGELALRGDAD